MRELLTQLLDTLFPPSRHTQALRNATTASFAMTYSPDRRDGVVILGQYAKSELQAAIHENKFHHSRRAAELLANHLSRWLVGRADVLLIPVPLGPKRLRERGHNQVESILRYIETPVARQVLIRRKETAPQSHLTRRVRLQNVTGAFAFSQLPDLTNIREIVIVDDVMTTGATLKEARATLAPHLPPQVRLTLLALAH